MSTLFGLLDCSNNLLPEYREYIKGYAATAKDGQLAVLMYRMMSILIREPLAKSARLSIRLAPTESEQFQRMAKQHNLTYREILVALMSQSGTGNQTAAALIQSQKERIERQQKEIAKARNPRGIQADERLKQALSFCQSGVQSYIKLICSQPQGNQFAPVGINRCAHSLPASYTNTPEKMVFSPSNLNGCAMERGLMLRFFYTAWIWTKMNG